MARLQYSIAISAVRHVTFAAMLASASLFFILHLVCNVPPVDAAGRRSPIRFTDNYYVGWRPDHVWLSDSATFIHLKLDNSSGSGFQSFHSYLHGYVSMKLKFPQGYSAGVVVAYYMSSNRELNPYDWDEIDFEFLGNVSGQPWICQTNIFTNGTGGHERRTYLWFDPTKKYHTYSILWNPINIIWYVDSVPIRVYRRTNTTSPTYPSWKPMNVYSSIWNGDNWATRGGQDKINWNYSPFIASYSKFLIDACLWDVPPSSSPPQCVLDPSPYWWANYTLTTKEKQYYTYYNKRYAIYDYCTDYTRYPVQRPECKDTPW